MKKAEKLSAAYFPKRPIYKEWVDLLKRFKRYLDWYRDDGDDVAYWYGERALSGFLASAAWDEGWSLEEFTGLRKHGKEKSAGRGDLWIGTEKRTFTVEAKVAWLGGPIDKAIKNIREQLGLAKSQLDKLGSDYRLGVPTAVCYAVPDLNAKTKYGTQNHVDELYAEMERTFSTSRKVVGSFRYKGNPPPDSGRIYPGVIVTTEFWSPWNSD
jgi:hypothetical protein